MINEFEQEKARINREFEAKYKEQEDQFNNELEDQQTEMKEKLGRADQ